MQKNIDVKFESIVNANHFYKNKEKELSASIDHYIKDKITIIQFLKIVPPKQGFLTPVVLGSVINFLK